MAKTNDYTVDQSATHFEVQVLPTEWHEKFGEEDKAGVESIINWMNRNKRTRGWLATAASVNRTTVTQLLNGQYPGRVNVYLKRLLDTIRHLDARQNVRESPFVTTSVSRMVITACNRARKMRGFAVLAANVGTGKTRTLNEYTADNANTFLIEASPLMSPGALLDELIDQLGVRALATNVTRERKFHTVKEQLKKMASPLIILDEAETVNPQTLHNIRRLRDMSGCGVVLAGTSKLYQIIAPKGAQFDQIRSRAVFFPQPIREITKQDAVAILTASFDDRPEAFDAEGEMHKALVSAFWYYSQGSARVLVEDLIPALRDYGLPQHKQLTADVIHAVAKDVLSLA